VLTPQPRPMVVNHLHSSLRVETLSFEEAADFNPQGRSIYFVPFNLGGRQCLLTLKPRLQPGRAAMVGSPG